MGFEITQGAVFYMVMMLIVVLLGIALVTGFKTPSMAKLRALSATFEPGSIYITNDDKDLSKLASLDCSGEVYKLTLDGIKFASKKSPGDDSDVFKFITVLDYNGMLFVGQLSGGNEDVDITCGASEEFFVCQDLKLDFTLRGLGKPTGKQVFHITTWESNPAIKNSITPGMTLSKLLDDNGQFYLSSFDIPIIIEKECARDSCIKISEEASCKSNNANGCYWENRGFAVFSSCEFCPEYTDCNAYSKEECGQCPISIANCKPGLVWGCEPK